MAGDSFLESQSLALNFATNNPGNINAWQEFVTAIRRLCQIEEAKSHYDGMTVFIDCNPSFSIYTQMALVSSDSLVIPMMADFSSLEGIKGILMLLYGKYPSSATANYAANVVTFNRQIQSFRLNLPRIFEMPFNNYTINAGVANAYGSVRSELIEYAWQQYVADPSIFATCQVPPTNKQQWENLFISDVKDFHTAGKVAASLGIPLHRLPQQNSYTMPNGTEISLPRKNYEESLTHLSNFVAKL